MKGLRFVAVLLVALAQSASAQVVVERHGASLTVEGWVNSTYAAGATDRRANDEDWQLDGALRGLALLRLDRHGRIGVRAVEQAFAGVDDEVSLEEHSVLWTGSLGRLEYGERQGLPDVLTGYAPNPFTFTTAEFGPASGLSLDPGGGLIERFVADDVAPVLGALSGLGYSTSLLADTSRKLLYVSPKRGGWLGAISYASDAEGGQSQGLVQSGLVHESYRGQSVTRIGAAWTRLDTGTGIRLDSWFAGASLDLDQTWLFGIAATWNPRESRDPVGGWASDAVGVTSSVNYNRGPWTVGGYLQYARGRQAAGLPGNRLRAAETGVSYRTSTRVRLFLSWYRYDLDQENSTTDDDLLIAGARLTI